MTIRWRDVLRFNPGKVVGTPGALEALEQAGLTPMDLMRRHLTGDWGDIHPGDVGLNEAALELGNRLFSVYRVAEGVKVWVITEADRSSTTLLLPEEY